MATDGEKRIWFHPTKFWEFTKNMPEEEVDRLFERVYRLAEQRDLNALREFDFISIGDVWHPHLPSVLAAICRQRGQSR